MALGSNDSNAGMDLMVLSLKQKKDQKNVPPYFAVKRKNEDTGKWETVDETNAVSGSLESIEVQTQEYEGNEYKTAKIKMKDADAKEMYLIDAKFSYLSRSLFNALISLENFDKVHISLYETKRKSDGKVFANSAVRDLTKPKEDNMVRWKYERDEIPAVEKVMNKKGEVKLFDSSEVDEFFEKELKELAARVEAAKGENSKEESSQRADEDENDVSFEEDQDSGEVEEEEDDVPF